MSVNEWIAGAQVVVLAHDDHTELRVPWLDEPLLIKPGESMRFSVGVTLTTQGYIEGLGFE